MTMKKTITFVCGRCEKEESDTTILYSWGNFWYGQRNGPIWIKSMRLPDNLQKCADLCEDCMRSLDDWYIYKKD